MATGDKIDDIILERRMQETLEWLKTFEHQEFTLIELKKAIGISQSLARNLIMYMSCRIPLYEYKVGGVCVYGILRKGQTDFLRDASTLNAWQRRRGA